MFSVCALQEITEKQTAQMMWCPVDVETGFILALQEIREKQTAQMMWCLVDFLAFMHNKGIMHRDLKPENILMSSRETDASIGLLTLALLTFVPKTNTCSTSLGQCCMSPLR